MHKITRALAGIALAASLMGLVGYLVPALALTNPPTFGPRMFPTQQTHYLRIDIGFNSIDTQPCILVALSGSNTCSIKVGAVPADSYFIRASMQLFTNFNSGNSDLIKIGTVTSGGTILNNTTVASGAGGFTSPTLNTSGNGVQATTGTQTGADGGFDIWVTYLSQGTAPTAGSGVIILEYIAPNDSACSLSGLGTSVNPC